MLESNISLSETKEKYSRDFIFFRKKKDQGENNLCDIIFVGSLTESLNEKKNCLEEEGYSYGLMRGVQTGYRSGIVRVRRV